MFRYLKALLAAIASMFLVASLAGCAPAEKKDMSSYAAVIDVRTPEEFATGHLAGAVNLDIRSGDFITEIAKLDRNADYYVYCHTGNRAGQAISYMTENGFVGTLTNGGGVDSAAAETGLAIVMN